MKKTIKILFITFIVVLLLSLILDSILQGMAWELAEPVLKKP
ncbi:MAG: hypothetical protein AB7F32_09790 [Victivallaceae bacterium]